jgi:hypothetical protein
MKGLQGGRRPWPPRRPARLAPWALAVVGAVVAARRPRHPVGWLPLAVGLLNATMAGIAYANDGPLAHRRSLPAAPVSAAQAWIARRRARNAMPRWEAASLMASSTWALVRSQPAGRNTGS